jgi:hypothetical protein
MDNTYEPIPISHIEYDEKCADVERLRANLLAATETENRLNRQLERAINALRGLVQYMGSTVDPDTEKRNGTSIEDVHVDSERFMVAYDAAVEVLEPKL